MPRVKPLLKLKGSNMINIVRGFLMSVFNRVSSILCLQNEIEEMLSLFYDYI